MVEENKKDEILTDEILGQLVLDSNAIIALLIQKGIITEEELNKKVEDLGKEMLNVEE
jgi:hypothetical protein